jgi:hydrogenase/urease accessory protein HupE
MLRRVIALVLLLIVSLVGAPAAFAHGLHASAETIGEFVWLGIRHMIGGWDHLLFIVGIVLLARETKLAAKLISLFVLGHSTTLLIATMAGWQFDPDVVDVTIAASVAYIGWRVLRGQPTSWAVTGTTIFAFGLVHGLGLATRLQNLDLPGGAALLARVIALNVGVEIGQLIALAVIVGLGLLALRYSPHLRMFRTQLAAGLIAFGVLAAGALSFIAVKDRAESPTSSGSNAACSEEAYEVPGGAGLTGGHPGQSFYSPGQAPPQDDLRHALSHGFTIVFYRETIPVADRGALADWTDDEKYAVVVPALANAPYVIAAFKPGRRLTCQGVNVNALSRFGS